VVQLSLHKTEVTEDLCWNWRWTLQTFTVTVERGKWCNYLCTIWNVTSVEIDHSQQTSTRFLCFWSVSVQNSTNNFSLWSNCALLKGMPKKVYRSKANFTFASIQGQIYDTIRYDRRVYRGLESWVYSLF